MKSTKTTLSLLAEFNDHIKRCKSIHDLRGSILEYAAARGVFDVLFDREEQPEITLSRDMYEAWEHVSKLITVLQKS